MEDLVLNRGLGPHEDQSAEMVLIYVVLILQKKASFSHLVVENLNLLAHHQVELLH